MNLFNIKEKHVFNIDLIDKQHQKIIDMINLLFKEISEKKPNSVIIESFNNIYTLAKNHFSEEEKLFEKHNFQLTKAHKKEHNDFFIVFDGYKERLKTDPSKAWVEISVFLKAWLDNHFENSDSDFSDFLKKQPKL